MGRRIKTLGLATIAALQGNRSRGRIPILGYHAIDDSGSYVSRAPRIFQTEIETLARLGCAGWSMSQLMNTVKAGAPIPDRVIVLTFDDGFRNFKDAAWPVLCSVGFSATLYVPTDYVGGTADWYRAYHLEPFLMLSWDELRQLRDQGADIQSHGCSHRKLTEISGDDARRELEQSKALIERELGVDVRHFCYPFGFHNAAVRRAAAESGYESAVTMKPGSYRMGDDTRAIRRLGLDFINVTDHATAERVARSCADGSYETYLRIKVALHRLLGIGRKHT